MKEYILEWYGSGDVSQIIADSEFEAIDKALELVGPEAVEAFEWQDDGTNDDGKPCKRILIWHDESKAMNDPGVHAVAKLTTVGRA